MRTQIPQITKSLLILNAIFFIAKYLLTGIGIDLDVIFGAYFPTSPNFHWYQIITHMFMHSGLAHFFFNMFALWMFGSAVEEALGTKKYLILYFVCGLGAFGLYNLVNYFEIQNAYHSLIENNIPLDEIRKYAKLNYNQIYTGNDYYALANQWYQTLPRGTNSDDVTTLFYSQVIGMVGASGAIYGLLVAFGVMFPNTTLMLIFPPIPMKAKYFIFIMILMELYLGIQQAQRDNVAHFAHLGGAVFGFFLTRHWLKNKYRWN